MADRIGSNGDPSQQKIELAANSQDHIAIYAKFMWGKSRISFYVKPHRLISCICYLTISRLICCTIYSLYNLKLDDG